MIFDYKINPFGERAVLVEFAEFIDSTINSAVVALTDSLRLAEGIIEVTPAYRSLLLEYDPLQFDYQEVFNIIRSTAITITKADEKTVCEIMVCYGGKFGPDIETVAKHNGISVNDVIFLHSEREYQVYMLGFLPGFPYLGGLSSKLATPRLATPRLSIPPGSVGIAGSQTGIYPISSPGGWQLIGRTPQKLFSPSQKQPFLLSAGDWLRFVPISETDYDEIENSDD
ncbi:MAG: 5-oxoprolinase subunit PxpB [Bacillota bacterium]